MAGKETIREGENALQNYIESGLDYIRNEFDLSYAEAIGVLEIIKLNLHQDLLEISKEDDELETDSN